MKIKDLFFTTLIATSALSSVQASQYNSFYDDDMALQKAVAASLQYQEDEDLALAIAQSLKDDSSPVFHNGGMSEDEALTAALNASLEDSEKLKGVDRPLQYGLHNSIESAHDEAKRGNYLGYNPYADIQEAEMKVGASLAAIKNEQEEIQASFIRSCDVALYNIYEGIKMARLAAINDNEVKTAERYLWEELAPYRYRYDTYFNDNSHYKIKEPINQVMETNPETILSAVVTDTGLTDEQVRNIFSNSYGWDF